MNRKALAVVLGLLFSVPVPSSAQQPAGNLTVVSSGPVGEVASLAEANEIRIVFSEPMVVLGRIPQPVTVPFVTIRPAIGGTYRWSGTTILIFTPDPARKLPYATQYEVTVELGSDSGEWASARRRSSFRLHHTDRAARRSSVVSPERSIDSPLVAALRFNQPVRPIARPDAHGASLRTSSMGASGARAKRRKPGSRPTIRRPFLDSRQSATRPTVPRRPMLSFATRWRPTGTRSAFQPRPIWS